jgi:hypothetical protein
MSVQKRSLIGSRPAKKKVTAQPVKRTEAIGEAKALTASALTQRRLRMFTFKAAAKKR